jgi:hypothetical protein
MSNLPKIAQLEFDTSVGETTPPRGKSFLFDFQTGQFILVNGKLVEARGIDALKVWIEKIMRTARDKFNVYVNTNYGCRNEDLIQEEIKRETLEALVQHKEINSVYNWQFVRDGSTMTISFTVDSIYGMNKQEVTI